HAVRDLDVRQALESRDLGLGELRPVGRQIEAAIAGEPRQHDVLEAKRLGISLRAVARADVAQRETPTRQPCYATCSRHLAAGCVILADPLGRSGMFLQHPRRARWTLHEITTAIGAKTAQP